MTTTSRRSIGTWATPVIPDSQFSDDGAARLEGHCRTLAQAKALIADGGTGVRDLVGVILRERCAVVGTLEQA